LVTTIAAGCTSSSGPATSTVGEPRPTVEGEIAIASDRVDGIDRIYDINADETGLTKITDGSTGGDFLPSWSPDGKKIAFVRLGGHGPEIFVVNADGTDPVRLTSGGVPSWSPDGTRIAFTRWRTPFAGDLWVMNPDGSGARRLTSELGVEEVPAWSPDGERIVFEKNFGEFTESDLFVMSAQGTHIARLTRNATLTIPRGHRTARGSLSGPTRKATLLGS